MFIRTLLSLGQTFCAQHAIVKAASVTFTGLQSPDDHANLRHAASNTTVVIALANFSWIVFA